MKPLKAKVWLLGAYLVMFWLVATTPWGSGMVGIFAKTLLFYCSLIISAHLVAESLHFWHWSKGWLRKATSSNRNLGEQITLASKG